MEHKNNDRTAKSTYTLADARKTVNSRTNKSRFSGWLILTAIIIVAGWLVFDKLFIIRNFRIDGKEEYTAEQARKAALEIGISEGGHILGFNREKAEKAAKYRLAEFDSVKIEFDMPDTVVLKVQEAFPAMYFVFGDGAFTLSPTLRVVSFVSDVSECENTGIIRIDIDGVTKCVAGEYLVTDNNHDELLKRLYAVLSEEGVAAETTSIDVTDKYDISFEYKNRFKVLLGDEENLTVKIRYMKAILDNLKPNDSGVIDVSDEEYRDATFKAYNKM